MTGTVGRADGSRFVGWVPTRQLTQIFTSSIVWGFNRFTNFLRISQSTSIGGRSGEFAGQSTMISTLSSSQLSAYWDMCAKAPSCWKVHPMTANTITVGGNLIESKKLRDYPPRADTISIVAELPRQLLTPKWVAIWVTRSTDDSDGFWRVRASTEAIKSLDRLLGLPIRSDSERTPDWWNSRMHRDTLGFSLRRLATIWSCV
jgi:hypothetical protein